jgi:3-deoxy-D-manno-octulosonic-acid transferase
MHFLYSLLIVVFTPFVLLYFAFRGLRDASYLGRWRERFGFIPGPVQTRGIHVHAASVGEFNAAAPLLRALLKTYPGVPVMVTTLTPTGSERVTRELGDKVTHCYIPLDLPGAVSRFLKRLQPRLIIVMETEIWPNLYLQANRMGIPLLMANARLSTRSVKRLQKMSGFTQRVLGTVKWVGAQSSSDAERLV